MTALSVNSKPLSEPPNPLILKYERVNPGLANPL